MAQVVLKDVIKRYPDGFQAVTGFNLTIEDGEFLILVGPSGCGKSTVLRMIAGLEEITEGSLHIGDRDVTELTPKERDIAMVFQSYALYPHMTVAENMGFALKLAKAPPEEISKRVNEAAQILDLQEHLDRKPAALSGGQRQRVAMGRAIVRQPHAFLMDEPLSNLDAKLRVQMRAEIAALQHRLGVTTIYVTHDQVEAMTMGHRVAVLKRGVLQQVDAPQVLYERPHNLFVAGFIGSPAMNIATATIIKSGSGFAVKIGDAELTLSDDTMAAYPGVANRVDQQVAVGLRPEHFVPAAEATAGARWGEAKVELVEMLGAEMLVHVESNAPPVVTEDVRAAVDDEDAFAQLQAQAEAGGQTIVARLVPTAPPRPGDTIDLGFRVEKLHFFDLETGVALR